MSLKWVDMPPYKIDKTTEEILETFANLSDRLIQRNIETENRITTLEVKITEIAENHLPHIQSKVDRIQWLLITNLIALVFILLKGVLT